MSARDGFAYVYVDATDPHVQVSQVALEASGLPVPPDVEVAQAALEVVAITRGGMYLGKMVAGGSTLA